MSTGPALMLIGHGSRSEAGVAQFWRFADVLQLAAPHLQLGCGLIELASPDLDEAIDELVGDGATSIVAVPLVLLGAGHLKDDGPAALARGRLRHPQVQFRYARDLGVHPLVLDAVAERARDAVRRLPGAPREGAHVSAQDGHTNAKTAVLLVGRGSSDPDANSDLYKASRLLADQRGVAGDAELDEVQPAFVSLARPSVSEGLDRLVAQGAQRIAVVPYFLFTGLLLDRIQGEADQWSAARASRAEPRVPIELASEIGPDHRIAELVIERYVEAEQGAAHMNCDGCLYRVPLPGHEHRVGTPPAGMP